jgi:Lectin C-type domain
MTIKKSLVAEGYGNGERYRKIYFLSKRSENWVKAAANCRANKLEIVSLETKNETQAFLSYIMREASNIGEGNYVHIGAVTKLLGTRNDWVWLESGRDVQIDIPWATGQPDNYGGSESCMSLKIELMKPLAHDLMCGSFPFRYVCQKKIVIPPLR